MAEKKTLGKQPLPARRYIAVQHIGNGNHAGNKARSDAIVVARQAGFEDLPVLSSAYRRIIAHVRRGRRFVEPFVQRMAFSAQLKRTEKTSIILFQYPPEYIHAKTFFSVLAKKKQRKSFYYIALIHDINSLRDFQQASHAQETEQLALFDALIVHNEVMKTVLRTDFAYMGRLEVLQLFDYLAAPHFLPQDCQRQAVVFAGNLTKSLFCRYLSEIPAVTFRLYGPCDDPASITAPNVSYCGQRSPEDIVGYMEGSFGLVWDGDSVRGCGGSFGAYLRYNSSHKLSLYIVAGLPVIVWKQAAVASFILENGLGIVVDSLEELPSVLSQLSNSDYGALCARVRSFALHLATGDRLGQCLARICGKPSEEVLI